MAGEYLAVLFDLGGTLWDAFGSAGREKVTRDAAVAAARALLGEGPAPEQLDKLALSIVSRLGSLRAAREDAASFSFASPAFREDDLSEVLAEAADPFGAVATDAVALSFGHDLTRHDKPYPETLSVLRRIRGERPDVVIGIVSNTVVQAAVIDHYLREQGILDLVDFRIVSSELGWRKPHPAIYAAALAKAGVKPQEALFVGDRPLEDVIGPARLGIRAALRTAPGAKLSLPAGCDPVAVVENLRGILELLSIS